jgi:hypothetical protein
LTWINLTRHAGHEAAVAELLTNITYPDSSHFSQRVHAPFSVLMRGGRQAVTVACHMKAL